MNGYCMNWPTTSHVVPERSRFAVIRVENGRRSGKSFNLRNPGILKFQLDDTAGGVRFFIQDTTGRTIVSIEAKNGIGASASVPLSAGYYSVMITGAGTAHMELPQGEMFHSHTSI